MKSVQSNNFSRLTNDELKVITGLQKEMHQRFRSVPKEGLYVDYCGERFIVLPHVFWPFEDSKPLFENMVIHPNDTVFDIGTGSGVLAILSAKKRATKIIAVDINPAAIENTKINVLNHKLEGIVEVYLSNLFEAIKLTESFDVIMANLPFRNHLCKKTDLVEASTWDEDLRTNKSFFCDVRKYLKPNGRIYLSQANFGAVDEILAYATSQGFTYRLIGSHRMSKDPRVFYAFELSCKGKP